MNTPFSAETRTRLAKKLGVPELKIPAVQSALCVIRRKGLIGRFSEERRYYIDDPNFKNWLLSDDSLTKEINLSDMRNVVTLEIYQQKVTLNETYCGLPKNSTLLCIH